MRSAPASRFPEKPAMKPARVLGLAGVAALAVAAIAYAQTTVMPLPDTAPVQTASLEPEKATWGDAKRGATLAGTCAACHGLDGNAVDPQYPRIAGHSERYIAAQLALYKSGERNTGMASVMTAFAAPLSAQDMRDLGAHFAAQKAGAGIADDTVIATGPYKDRKFYEVGQQLFRGGDSARGLPACMACHGPDGLGNPGPAYPALAGQHSTYTKRRLEEYRAGTTTLRDPALWNIMASVAKTLTDEEIGAVSSYLQGLHPRANDVAAAKAPANAEATLSPVNPATTPLSQPATATPPAAAPAGSSTTPAAPAAATPAAAAPGNVAPATPAAG